MAALLVVLWATTLQVAQTAAVAVALHHNRGGIGPQGGSVEGRGESHLKTDDEAELVDAHERRPRSGRAAAASPRPSRFEQCAEPEVPLNGGRSPAPHTDGDQPPPAAYVPGDDVFFFCGHGFRSPGGAR